MTGDLYIPGPVRDEIATAVVRIYRDFVGRGPRTVKVHSLENIVVIIAEHPYTTAERSLITSDHRQSVMQLRTGFQSAMQDAISEVVRTKSGHEIDAFMSANHIEPDLSVEIVVLR